MKRVRVQGCGKWRQVVRVVRRQVRERESCKEKQEGIGKASQRARVSRVPGFFWVWVLAS